MAKRNSMLELTLIICIAAVLTAGLSIWLKSSVPNDPLAGLEIGNAAPDIRVAGWLNGEPPTASVRAGKVVVVNAWFTRCPNCHRQAPELVRTYEKFHERGVVFIGLTYEDAGMLDDIQKSINDMGMTWPNGYGALGTLEAFETEAFPAIWVIGGDGTIVWNFDSTEPLDRAIENALAAVDS